MLQVVKKKVAPTETTRISSKHQITIGRRAFAQAGLRAGDVLQVRAIGVGIGVARSQLIELVARYSGALNSGGALRKQVDELRDEWD